MPLFRIPIKWTHWGYHEVEAKDVNEAIHFTQFMSLPYMEELIPDSIEVIRDKIEEIK